MSGHTEIAPSSSYWPLPVAAEAPGTELIAALLALQDEVPTLPLDGTNPHFNSKFTKLGTIVDTVRPLLARHGLVWIAMPCRDGRGEPALRYRLAHSSGQTITGTMPLLLTKSDPQGQGSAITYARRYALAAVLNLVADEDDDGNAGSAPPAQRSGGGNRPPGKPSAKQLELIENLLRKAGASEDEAKAGRAYAAEALTGGRDGTASRTIDMLNGGDAGGAAKRLVAKATGDDQAAPGDTGQSAQSDGPADTKGQPS